jgi:hypothetical protein
MSAVPTGQAATAFVTDADVFGMGRLTAATRVCSSSGSEAPVVPQRPARPRRPVGRTQRSQPRCG